MKIIFPIGSYYPSQSGGPNNTIYWIAKALMRNGVQTTVVTTDSGIKPEHSILLNNMEERDSGMVGYYKTIFIYFPVRAIIETVKRLRMTDIIHLNSIFYPLSWSTALINFVFFQKPIVWSPRGELDPDALEYSFWKKKPVLRLVKILTGRFVTFHATCDAEKKYIHNHFGHQISVIQLPNYLELPNQVNEEKGTYLLYIGRIHPKKAIENLIEALSKSKLFLASEFMLKIAGDANSQYGLELKQMVVDKGLSAKVSFVGHVEGRAKQVLIAKSFFSFMPSHTENFGNVVVEALAQGTPVVASKGTPWKILQDVSAGYWVDNSVESLASIIDKVLSLERDIYDNYCENAKKLAAAKFDIDKNIMQWVKAYNTLI